jgi:DtxR family Mn-dependent transcriptional regulator
MTNPILTLLVGALSLAVLFMLFWPRAGFLARWKSSKHQTTRILVEDALKHLYDFEYKNLPSTLESLSGVLAVSGDDVVELLGRLAELKLVCYEGTRLKLTSEGHSYALRIIRIHRLWERYLSDETTVAESEWHTQAEYKEHHMSAQEVDALSQRLGHPVYDPHGDPIPTATGAIAPLQGKPLTALTVGQIGAIVHIEDEPDAIYAQLVAQGLRLGMQVRVLDRTTDRIVLESQGNEIALAPVSAANLTVIPLALEAGLPESERTLSSLEPGRKAVIRGISTTCRGLQRRRLLDIGLVPGTVVEVEMRSAGGDPTAYRIRGASIALRKEQADLVFIEEEKGRSS